MFTDLIQNTLTHQSKFDQHDEISPDDHRHQSIRQQLDLIVNQVLANQPPIYNKW